MPRLENAEGVDEQIVEAIVATKKKELDAMEAFGIFDVRRIANEMGKRSERRQVEMQVRSQRVQTWRSRNGRTLHLRQHISNRQTGGHACGSARILDPVPRCRECVLPCWGRRGCLLLASERMSAEVPRQRWTSGEPLVGTEETALWKTESCEEQCPEQPSLFRRPGTTLIFECHQEDFYVSGSFVELAWLQENLGARLKLKPAGPMGPGSKYSYFRATRTRVDADTIHIAPRETYIRNVLDILDLSDNKCKPMPTPIFQTRQKSDEDEPRLGEEDISCSTAQTSLLQSTKSARRSHRPETQTSEDCDDLAGISQGQKLGILIRKCNDPEHLDAYTDVDWSGDSIHRKSTSGGILKIGSATLSEFTNCQSCQTFSSGESEYCAAVTTTTAEALAPPTTPGILGNACQASIENRFNSSSRHHPEARMRTSQAHWGKTIVASSETRGKKVNGDQGTDANEHSRRIHESVADSEVLGFDNGDDVETSKREALAESGQWARVEALQAVPRLVLIATQMQQEFTTRRHRWNDWNWLSKAWARREQVTWQAKSTNSAKNRKSWSPTWRTRRSSNFAKPLPKCSALTVHYTGRPELPIVLVGDA